MILVWIRRGISRRCELSLGLMHLARIIHKVDKLCFLPGQEGIGTNYVSSDCVHRVGPPYPQTHSSREASRIGLPESSCTVERQRVAAAENLAADLFVVVEIWPAR